MSGAEEWKPIPGWEGSYEVSTYGRVRSVPRLVVPKGHVKAVRFPGRVLRAAPVRGYLAVSLNSPSRKQTKKIHRLVLEAFVGPPPEGHQGCHRDGSKLNNRLENLYWGTISQNSRDAIRHGTHPKASKTHCPKGHNYADNPRPGARWRECRICDADMRLRKRIALRGVTGEAFFKGDRLQYANADYLDVCVVRAAKDGSWIDVSCYDNHTHTAWARRIRLPLPGKWIRVPREEAA